MFVFPFQPPGGRAHLALAHRVSYGVGSYCLPLLGTESRGITAQELLEQEGRIVTLLGYLITTKPVPTKNGKRMAFGYFLDQDGQYFDTTNFCVSLERYPLRGLGMYRIEGKVVIDYGCPG